MCVKFHYQTAGQNHNLLIGNKSCENVAEFRYLRTAVTNQVAYTKKLRTD